jgi:itaconyl-CoA hydratase
MPPELPTVAQLRQVARQRPRGRLFEDFTIGQQFSHHWGRTLTESDNTLFCSLTLNYNPLYLNAVYARAHGHDGTIINPYLVFLVVFGLSVEDLSEAGIAFLGVDDLTFHTVVRPGDTVTARSTVTELRRSASRPGAGIATWHTEGFREDGTLVVDFRRTNLLRTSGDI